jgi:hypothetical protein
MISPEERVNIQPGNIPAFESHVFIPPNPAWKYRSSVRP